MLFYYYVTLYFIVESTLFLKIKRNKYLKPTEDEIEVDDDS
jgi:hypothetical protein